MIAYDSKSYPWLAIAQHHGVPYSEVLRIVEALDSHTPASQFIPFPEPGWLRATIDRWLERGQEANKQE